MAMMKIATFSAWQPKNFKNLNFRKNEKNLQAYL